MRIINIVRTLPNQLFSYDKLMMMERFFYWQKCCQTFPPPASAWMAESQAEERREWEARSASKPWVTAASSSCRLKSAATWGSNRKAGEHQPRSTLVRTHPNSRLHLQSASWRTRRLSLVAARRTVGNILLRKESLELELVLLGYGCCCCYWSSTVCPADVTPCPVQVRGPREMADHTDTRCGTGLNAG